MGSKIARGGVLILAVVSLVFIWSAAESLALNWEKVGDEGIEAADPVPGEGRHNSYAWCMDVLDMDFGVDDPDNGEYLYVGSNRDFVGSIMLLSMWGPDFSEWLDVYTSDPPDSFFAAGPPPYPDDYRDMIEAMMTREGELEPDLVFSDDPNPRIFRYKTDGSKGWEHVFTFDVTEFVGAYELWPYDDLPTVPFAGFRICKTFTDTGGNTAFYAATTDFYNLAPNRVYKFPADFNPATDEPEIVFESDPSGGGEKTIRSMEIYDGYLYVGLGNGDAYISNNPLEDVPDDPPEPDAAVWTRVSERGDFDLTDSSGRGETRNFQSLTVGHYLYTTATVTNSVYAPPEEDRGFRVYRGQPDNPAEPTGEWTWEERQRGGAGNEWNEAAGLYAYGDQVYVGSFLYVVPHVIGGDIDEILDMEVFDNSRPEVFRFEPVDGDDDIWEMVVGDPELNTIFDERQSDYGSGFWQPTGSAECDIYNTLICSQYPEICDLVQDLNLSLTLYMWWMEEYNGKFYVGTFEPSVFLLYIESFAAYLGLEIDQETLDLVMDYFEACSGNPPGADLYVTSDGASFSPVTLSGFVDGSGEPDEYNYGFRTLKASADALFAGTANPFFGFQIWKGTVSSGGGGGGGGGCFIATAAYGSPIAEEVIVLREFRDRYLATSWLGNKLVGAYYWASPPIADIIAKHTALKAAARLILIPVVGGCKIALDTPHVAGFFTILGGGFILAMLMLFAKRKASSRT